MKILFICPQNPFYKGSGAHQRSYLILKALVAFGADVDVIFFDKRYAGEDQQLLSNVSLLASYDFRMNRVQNIRYKLRYLSGFGAKIKRSGLSKKVLHRIKDARYDYVFARYVDVVQELGLENLPNLVVDVDDSPCEVYKVRFQNTSNKLLKFWYWIASKNAARYMRNNESKFLRAFYPQGKQCLAKNSVYLPNIPMVDVSLENAANLPKNKTLLYVGVLSWMPNYLGLDHFINCIWPRVLDKDNNAKLKIVGKGLPFYLKDRWTNVPGIQLLGFVPDLEPEYKKARAVIVPIYQGGGTNIKVLEALAYGKAVVLSAHACRGFEDVLVRGENCLIASDDDCFANDVVSIINDDVLCAKFQESGPQIIQKNFSMANFTKIIHESLWRMNDETR